MTFLTTSLLLVLSFSLRVFLRSLERIDWGELEKLESHLAGILFQFIDFTFFCVDEIGTWGRRCLLCSSLGGGVWGSSHFDMQSFILYVAYLTKLFDYLFSDYLKIFWQKIECRSHICCRSLAKGPTKLLVPKDWFLINEWSELIIGC